MKFTLNNVLSSCAVVVALPFGVWVATGGFDNFMLEVVEKYFAFAFITLTAIGYAMKLQEENIKHKKADEDRASKLMAESIKELNDLKAAKEMNNIPRSKSKDQAVSVLQSKDQESSVPITLLEAAEAAASK